MTDYYANTAEVTEIVSNLLNISLESFTAKLTIALKLADSKVNSKLDESTLPDPVPDIIQTAATAYAVAKLLDMLHTTSDERNPIAVAWEKDALALLDDYTTEKPESKTSSHSEGRVPVGSLTRGRRY